jgi:protein SCO1/2
MSISKKWKGRIFLLTILALVCSWVFILSRAKYEVGTLPYFGEKYTNEAGDTVYHTIENFILTDHRGDKITHDSLLGKIHLANFFFTSCPSICPAINNNLNLVVNKFQNVNDVMFVSYTVDPKVDTVEQLAKYAKKYGNQPNWYFVTGGKSSIYRLAEFSYLAIGSGASKSNWAHTEKVTLVDHKGRIRGVYEGRGDQRVLNEIIDAIKLLRLEKNKELSGK